MLIDGYAQAPSWEWAKSVGGSGNETANSVITDSLGNLYMVGWFRSQTISLGSNILTNHDSNSYEISILKYDQAGNVVWAQSFGGTSHDYAISVTTNAIGNFAVVGNFMSSTLTLGSITLMNTFSMSQDFFIAKYSATGTVLWAYSAGGTNSYFANFVTHDASGNLIAIGSFDGPTITFDSTTFLNAGNCIVKYDTAGTVLWVKLVGGSGSGHAVSICTDVSANIIIAGEFQGSVTFDSATIITAGNYDMFVAKTN